jgi:hypothetical protein
LTSVEPFRAGYVVAAVAWIGLCLVAGLGDDLPAADFLLGGLVRVVVTAIIAMVIRALYLRRHRGRLVAPDTIWIAAAFAALLAAGNLSA